MSEPKDQWTVRAAGPGGVEWIMPWSKYGGRKDGSTADEAKFEEEKALALLLIDEIVFLNSYWWEDKWPEEARKVTSINVNCNDVFAWGCADAESLPHDQIEPLYRMWRKDPAWGAAIWCMIQRKQMPQKPVEDLIRKAGIWDLDTLGLGTNTMDAKVSAMFAELGASQKAKLLLASANEPVKSQEKQPAR